MADEQNKPKFISREFLQAYILIGLFVVAMLLRFIWGEDGFMTDVLSYQRILTVLAAIAFGFGLGWLVYPRRPRWPWQDD